MMNLFENLQMMKEADDLIRFSYTGPVYRFNSLYGQIKKPIYTVARTHGKAYANFLAQIKQGNGFDFNANLQIDKNRIKEVDSIPDSAIDDSIDNIEDIGKSVVDDPKYNYDDPDREGDYVVESILSFEKWLDINFDNLINNYAERYNMNEFEVATEDSDFEEYVNEKYNEYFKNASKHLDNNLKEDFNIDDDLSNKYSLVKNMKEPDKFNSIKISFNGYYNDVLEFCISNMGTNRYQAYLSINNGKDGRFKSNDASSFDEAKSNFNDLINKYIQYMNRFIGKTLSPTDMSDLMH